jgi:hypothetical protein
MPAATFIGDSSPAGRYDPTHRGCESSQLKLREAKGQVRTASKEGYIMRSSVERERDQGRKGITLDGHSPPAGACPMIPLNRRNGNGHNVLA